MKSKPFVFCLFVSFIGPTNLFGKECLLRFPADVLNCVMQNHPRLQESAVKVEQGNQLENIANQIPNPELSSNSVIGKGNTPGHQVDVSLTHTFELGGKKNARTEKALAEFDRVTNQHLALREKVFIDTYLSLYRIGQLQTEGALLDDALKTFQSTEELYRKRIKLTPEQTTLLSIFEIAANEYKLRKLPIEQEIRVHIAELSHALRVPFHAEPYLIPRSRNDWPELGKENFEFKGSIINAAKAEVKFSQSLLSVEESNAWPNVKLGPSFQSQDQNSQIWAGFGVNLSLPLPLYHRNAAGKAFANQGVMHSELALSHTEEELDHQRTLLLTKYEEATRDLSTSIPLEDLQKRRTHAEGFFRRGVIPGELLIEIHRQIYELRVRYHEREVDAMTSMLTFLAMKGRLFEEKL